MPPDIQRRNMPIKQMCYRQNYLSKVILRADFGTNSLSLESLTERTKFTENISTLFPHVSSAPLVHLQLDVGQGGADGVKHTNVGTQWTHRKTVEGTAQIILEPTFIALEYGPGDYDSFNEFLIEFTFLLEQLSVSFGSFPFDRIGLRYVNEIRLPGKALDWIGIIRDELVNAVMASAISGGRLLRSMHQVVELHGDDQVLFNYGIFNPDFPAPAVQRFFIIDIDCSRNGIIPTNEALVCVKQLNEYASVGFESSIGDGLRDLMGVKT